MKKKTTKSPKNKATQKEKSSWVDVHNDNVMREIGFFRPFKQTPRDKSVWTKTPLEKAKLHARKNECKKLDMHFNMAPLAQAKVYAKLIVQLKPNKVFSKTTYSYDCFDINIRDIIDQFRIKDKSFVLKYSFNGKCFYMK